MHFERRIETRCRAGWFEVIGFGAMFGLDGRSVCDRDEVLGSQSGEGDIYMILCLGGDFLRGSTI